MNRGFVKLVRSRVADELMRDRNAFALLSLIAYRARFTDEPNADNLAFGEAQVGDFRACGLSRKEYRGALDRLEWKWHLISTHRTRAGTVAKLSDSRVYSLADERQNAKNGHQKGHQVSEVKPKKGATERANRGPIEGHLRATNQNVENGEKVQTDGENVEETETTAAAGATAVLSSSDDLPESIPASIEQVYAYGDTEGIPREQADAWWRLSTQGNFRIKGKRMHDWKKAFLSWAFADAAMNRPKADGIGHSAFWEFAKDREYPSDAVNRFIKYNQAHGWKKENPLTGRTEPIIDMKKALTAFIDRMSPGELGYREAEG